MPEQGPVFTGPRGAWRKQISDYVAELEKIRVYPPDLALLTLVKALLEENENLERLLYEKSDCVICPHYLRSVTLPPPH